MSRVTVKNVPGCIHLRTRETLESQFRPRFHFKMNAETIERPNSSEITIGCLLELQYHTDMYAKDRGCHHTPLKNAKIESTEYKAA